MPIGKVEFPGADYKQFTDADSVARFLRGLPTGSRVLGITAIKQVLYTVFFTSPAK